VFSREVDAGSRDENASKQKLCVRDYRWMIGGGVLHEKEYF
jgi:hypothetical protein